MTDKPIKRKIGGHTIAIGGIGPDIDLDQEAVYLSDGTRLTGERAEQLGQEIAAEAQQRRAGRPSVTGGNVRTPSLTIRVPAPVRSRLEVIAKRQGKRLADVGRDALAEYAARHVTGHGAAAVTKAAPKKATAKAPAKVVRTAKMQAKASAKVAKVPAKAVAKKASPQNSR